ncbi:3'-5' exonuclease, partial [Nocardioides sp. R-C-SC26]|uniref:3'-5' exonuclease n=1 Tax=Nocardioides sp. R-C-SC26 TaxID=2870414 RepID=UPI0027E14787
PPRRGGGAVLESASAGGLPARLLRHLGGERRLTDLRHIGEALHDVGHRDRLGLVALLAWLRRHVADARSGRTSGGDRTRRLDSDARAVQLVTIHASKGLQYPVVYLPALADRFVPKADRPLFHDVDGRRCLDVGGAGPQWGDHVARWAEEEAGEWLRLLYVAVTRAQSQVVLWWAPTKNAVASPLHRLLHREPGEAFVPDSPPVPPEGAVIDLLGRWRDAGGPAPELAQIAPLTASEATVEVADLGVRTFGRSIDLSWRRTSYSALSAAGQDAAHAGAGVDSEPEIALKDDEAVPALVELPSVVEEPDRGTRSGVSKPGDPTADPDHRADLHPHPHLDSPMATLPVGARFGSLVHAVLEHADPDAPDLRAELVEHIAEQLTWWPVDLDVEVLADALIAVCDTPLGESVGGLSLRQLPLRDRLRELDFELPLAGGDEHRADAPPTLADVAPLLRRHLPQSDPIRAYAGLLVGPSGPTTLGEQSLHGYLTGSVDVVLRHRGDDGEARYVIVDYKTNWLGPRLADLPAPVVEERARVVSPVVEERARVVSPVVEERARVVSPVVEERAPASVSKPSDPTTHLAPLNPATHYARPALIEAMGHSDYPLQALLYAVVLHRFLRWRQPGYDPHRHLGGVLYLYVRGLAGPATPVVDGDPCGVFAWTPPVALLDALSDLLDGRLAREERA